MPTRTLTLLCLLPPTPVAYSHAKRSALCAAAARAADPQPPAGVLNVTKATNALEGAATFPEMSILNGVIKSDPYMADYLKKKQPLTAFPSINDVSEGGGAVEKGQGARC